MGADHEQRLTVPVGPDAGDALTVVVFTGDVDLDANERTRHVFPVPGSTRC